MHNMSKVMMGVAAGAVVGTTAYVMTAKNMKKTRKTIKKATGKAIKAVGDVIENVSYMMK